MRTLLVGLRDPMVRPILSEKRRADKDLDDDENDSCPSRAAKQADSLAGIRVAGLERN